MTAQLPRRTLVLLWAGVLGPPVALLFNLELTYAVAGLYCEGRLTTRLLVHVVPALLCLVAVTLGSSSFVHWRMLSPARGSDNGRLLAVMGVLSSAFFTLLLLAQWMPSFLLDPCLLPQ